MKCKEIERKWLVPPNTKPIGIDFSTYQTSQFYLVTAAEHELRFSACTSDGETHYKCTVKLGNGMSRTEIETEITAEAFHEALMQSKSLPIYKEGIHFEFFNIKWYVSQVDDWYWSAEAEFQSEEAANAFDILTYSNMLENVSGWEEVTNQSRHSMKKYWEIFHLPR